jgi:Aspartyl protease
MMKLYDDVPVITLSDERTAIVDTGASGADIITNTDRAPVRIRNRLISPIVARVDLAGIARGIGAPRVDMLIGASVLYGGFTVDFRNGTFEFAVLPAAAGEELAATLPYVRPVSGPVTSPKVKVEIGGEEVLAIFDTGAAYSLFKRCGAAPDRPVHVGRMDFYVDLDGSIVEFPVLMRHETVRLGNSVLNLDVAYLPDTFPELYPDCVLGMDVPKVLGASRMVLDPDTQELRFYRPRL